MASDEDEAGIVCQDLQRRWKLQGAGKRVETRGITGPKLIKLWFKWAVYYLSILS